MRKRLLNFEGAGSGKGRPRSAISTCLSLKFQNLGVFKIMLDTDKSFIVALSTILLFAGGLILFVVLAELALR